MSEFLGMCACALGSMSAEVDDNFAATSSLEIHINISKSQGMWSKSSPSSWNDWSVKGLTWMLGISFLAKVWSWLLNVFSILSHPWLVTRENNHRLRSHLTFSPSLILIHSNRKFQQLLWVPAKAPLPQHSFLKSFYKSMGWPVPMIILALLTFGWKEFVEESISLGIVWDLYIMIILFPWLQT